MGLDPKSLINTLWNGSGIEYFGKTMGKPLSAGFDYVNGKTATAQQKSADQWYVEVADINPQDLDQTITVEVNGELSVVYSPMTYMARMSAKGSENLQALLNALYNYHLAAKSLAA